MNKMILIVDDDPFMLAFYRLHFKRQAYEVITAENGQQGLTILAALASPPALIIMDKEMPVLSGLEMCQALMADPRWQFIPRILLSAGDYGSELAGYEFQAVLSKPFAFEDLFRRVVELVS